MISAGAEPSARQQPDDALGFAVAHDARVNITTAGFGTDDAGASNSSISGSGERVVFESASDALDPIPDGQTDVFVRHRTQGITTLASRASDGSSGNGPSGGARISGDSRFVAFSSSATNLVIGDDDDAVDSFVHDLETGITRLVEVSGRASTNNRVLDLSDDGHLVLIAVGNAEGPGTETADAELHVVDWRQESTVFVGAIPASQSADAALSGDGRRVAFVSTASLNELDTNQSADAYLFDLATDGLQLVSVDKSGAATGGVGSSIDLNSDGSTVQFTRELASLVDDSTSWIIAVRDIDSEGLFEFGTGPAKLPVEPVVSMNRTGTHLVMSTSAPLAPDDSNDTGDVYRIDVATGSSVRISLDRHGEELALGATISPKGRHIADDGLLIIIESASSRLVRDDSNEAIDIFAATPAITCQGRSVSIFISAEEQPTEGDDVILGTEAGEDIDGGDGDDLICAGGGDDVVLGGDGNDQIFGEAGRDVIEGGNGNDRLFGGPGDDELLGGEGRDRIFGEAGNDLLEGGSGRDRVFGASGNDTLRGDRGADLLNGGAGDDLLLGGRSKDKLLGAAGSDDLQGGRGKDILKGGGGDDHLDGGAGSDKIKGGNGVDTCVGGPDGDPARDRISKCER